MRFPRSRMVLALVAAAAVTTYPQPSAIRVAKVIKGTQKTATVAKNRLANIESTLSKLTPLTALPLSQLTALASLSTSQLNALAGISSVQLSDIDAVTGTQWLFLSNLTSTQTGYLSGLSKLPSQSDSNTTLSGVLTWANNKQDNMDAHGF